MKTIKTIALAATVSLFGLTNAHAAGLVADVWKTFPELRVPTIPDDRHPIPRCWPNWPDPRIVSPGFVVPEVLRPRPKCVPFNPAAITRRDFQQQQALQFHDVTGEDAIRWSQSRLGKFGQ